MHLNHKLLAYFKDEAEQSVIDEIHLGLGYTAVTLTDGRCGLCHTWIESKKSCTLFKEPGDYEQQTAIDLLKLITSDDLITRSAVIALINALNYSAAEACDPDKGVLFADLGLKEGSKLAMVGYFAPVVKQLNKIGVEVKAYDIGKGVGSREEFFSWARDSADAMILTATSLINNSFESVIEDMGAKEIPTVLMGPSTIMVSEVFEGTPVSILAGTLPLDNGGILKAIRNGKGTPALLKHAKKVYKRI